MKSPATGTIFLRIFIFFLGLMMLFAALNKLYTYCDYRCRGSMAWGIVDHPSSGRDVGGRPLIQYKDAAGELHEFKSRAKTHWFRTPQKGERIKIYFLSNEPKNAIADSPIYYIFLPLIFLVSGGYCCLYGAFGRKTTRRPDR